MNIRLILLNICALSLAIPALLLGDDLTNLTVSSEYFNPSAHESVTISFDVDHDSDLSVIITNLQGGVVKTLLDHKQQSAGHVTLEWDGLTDGHQIVNDAAFLLQIETDKRVKTIASEPGPALDVQPNYYDRADAVIGYTLATPAFVTIKAGRTLKDESGATTRNVTKVILENAPRVSGSIVQVWNGIDNNGVYLPDLTDSFIVIETRPLPAHTIITTGNPGNGGSL